VGLGAPHDTEMQQPGAGEVVDEPSTAREETLVLLPSRRGTDHVAPESITAVEDLLR